MTPTELYVGLAKALSYGFSLECGVCAWVQCSPPGMKPEMAVQYLMMNGWSIDDERVTCAGCRSAN